MSTPDFFHAEHRKRLRKIWADALSSIVGICCSLLSIYWTVTHGLPFKAYLFDGAARTVVVFTAAIYILAQVLALATCRLRSKNSALLFKKHSLQHALSQQDDASVVE